MSFRDKLEEAYRGKTVLITGHTGFKGGWLALWLESLGAKIIGFSWDVPTNPSFFQKTNLSGKITDLRGDVRDYNTVSKIIHEHNPEIIFHLAAQPLVRASYAAPRETIDANVMGTANVLEAIRVSGGPATCVCITSDKCYENREWDYAYRENDSLGGYDPYSASKGAAEIIIASYRRSFFSGDGCCALASTRAGNIIGGGDWSVDRIVPDCIRSLHVGKPIELRNPSAIRPWQFILDPLYGYLLLAQKMQEKPKEYSEAWNFGPDYRNNVDVCTLTQKMIAEWGSGTCEYPSSGPNTLHEARFLKLDISKTVSRLGWRPQYCIDTAVRNTVEWYKRCYSPKAKMDRFSLQQIDHYMEHMDASSGSPI
jgi:CDP-glucose 4,6-dehydratase